MAATRIVALQRRGFTLVELLVTIAIIGILASLGFAGLRRAKRKAQLTECLSNLRQQGIALSSFVQSHNVFPYYIPPPGSRRTEHRTMWASAIAEGSPGGLLLERGAEEKKGMFKCPAARFPTDLPAGDGFACYGYNAFGLSGATGEGGFGLGGFVENMATGPRPVREDEVTRPNEMMAIGDGVKGNSTYLNDGLAVFTRTAEPNTRADASQRITKLHGGKLAVVFADGHTEPLSIAGLFSETSVQWLSKWNRDGQAHSERLN